MRKRVRFARFFAWAFAGVSAGAVAFGIFAVAAFFSLPACNLQASGAGSCPSVSTNSGNGSSTCGTTNCTPGNYCANPSGNICSSGCMSPTDCAFGQYCDLSNAVKDLAGNKVGTCAEPTLQQQSAPCPTDGGSDAGDASSPKDASGD